MFEPSQSEAIVGTSIQGRYRGAELGSELEFGRGTWKVVGVFESGGSSFESEVWVDARELARDAKRPMPYSGLRLRAAPGADMAALARRIGDDSRWALEATPEIDRLATTADVFLNAYSPAPYTRAAMVSLWTSLEPGASGALEAPRLAERLSARGIHTAGFVGNPNAGPACSFDRGFAEFHEAYTDGAQAESFRPLLRRFLSESGNRRFFIYVHYREPHFRAPDMKLGVRGLG